MCHGETMSCSCGYFDSNNARLIEVQTSPQSTISPSVERVSRDEHVIEH